MEENFKFRFPKDLPSMGSKYYVVEHCRVRGKHLPLISRFVRMTGLSSFRNMSEYLTLVTVLENRGCGCGMFMFVIVVVHWRPGHSESITLSLPFLNKSL
jgi:hypothetical protein